MTTSDCRVKTSSELRIERGFEKRLLREKKFEEKLMAEVVTAELQDLYRQWMRTCQKVADVRLWDRADSESAVSQEDYVELWRTLNLEREEMKKLDVRFLDSHREACILRSRLQERTEDLIEEMRKVGVARNPEEKVTEELNAALRALKAAEDLKEDRDTENKKLRQQMEHARHEVKTLQQSTIELEEDLEEADLVIKTLRSNLSWVQS